MCSSCSCLGFEKEIILSCGCCCCFRVLKNNFVAFMLFLILGKSLTVMCCSLGFLRKSCFSVVVVVLAFEKKSLTVYLFS